MELLILVLKILITEQKVNFLDNICHICEKIERWLMEKFLFYCLCGAAWYLCLWAIHHALLALVVGA